MILGLIYRDDHAIMTDGTGNEDSAVINSISGKISSLRDSSMCDTGRERLGLVRID